MKWRNYYPYKNRFNDYQYLKEMSADMIFNNYMAVWPTLPVPGPGLTQEQNMQLMDLKMRATLKVANEGLGVPLMPIDESIKQQFKYLNDSLAEARKTI